MTATRAAGVSVLSNIFIILLEGSVGLAMGSLSVMAGALDSVLNLMASLIAFFGLTVAYRPPDHGHPFGHGKAENLSALVEGLLILAGAAIIIFQAVRKLLGGVTLQHLGWGMGVMAFSAIANILVSRFLYRQAKRHDSLALEADAKHLVADVYTSLGILGGLLVVRLTGFNALDSLVAMGVAVLILKMAWDVSRRSVPGLVDARLPAEEEAIIQGIIEEHYRDFVNFHELRTRSSGRTRYIELHLVLSGKATLDEAHQLCDHLEGDLASRLPHASITIHVEPWAEERQPTPPSR